MRMLMVMTALLCYGLPAVSLNRPADPVILTGADVPQLAGIAPNDLVAFRFVGGWEQIPVQVDERAVINFTQVYHGNTTYGNFSRLDYTDAGTFTGPDPDPTVDGDDEIVFMVKDTGLRCPLDASAPAGVLAGTAVEVSIADPLDIVPGYVYLFEQDGALDPGAGLQYVDYTFNLLAGDYKTKYKLGTGPNPENSFIRTDYYERHFSDRWKSDGLRIFAGSATGEDILDRHKCLFAPGYCGRSEDTFCAAEGAFIVNKNGPVRALRSYVGANSGPRTQRQHAFYAQREDITTFLRVHSIPAIMDFFDYSPEAAGMTYYNNQTLAGVTIDGVPDTVTAGALQWELVRGAQGALAMLHVPYTDAPGLIPSSYYLDQANTTVTQCTGDAHAYGQSGHWYVQTIPNTDPNKGAANLLSIFRSIYYKAPGTTVADMHELKQRSIQPLSVTLQDRPFDQDTPLPAARPATLALLAAILLSVAPLARRQVPRRR